VARVGDPKLCAVHWVERHFQECPPPSPGAMAFRMPRAGHSIPLFYLFYLGVLKTLCPAACFPPEEFSTHSLRRGCAIFLRLCGAEVGERYEGSRDPRFITELSCWLGVLGLKRPARDFGSSNTRLCIFLSLLRNIPIMYCINYYAHIIVCGVMLWLGLFCWCTRADRVRARCLKQVRGACRFRSRAPTLYSALFPSRFCFK
jgi:hypothetical protein